MIPLLDCTAEFGRIFEAAPAAAAFAPGRVNLIGEHIDYLGGSVLPMALSRGVTIAAALSDSGGLQLHSDFASGRESGAEAEAAREQHCSQAARLAGRMLQLCGIEHARICAMSDLPIGWGLSSSAAFCVALARALLQLSGRLEATSTLELPELARRCEVEALGVNCGLMDQYVSAVGAVIAFDTRSLSHETLQPRLDGLQLLIFDSGQARSLAGSGYNLRRAEIEQALNELRALSGGFDCFRELHIDSALAAARRLDSLSQRRLRHVYAEQRRVQQFRAALVNGDAAVMGALLNASHQSLSRDFEVSTPEVDALVALLQQSAGILGARIVGGGFGGAVLALADAEIADETLDALLLRYRQTSGLAGAWLRVEGIGIRDQVIGNRDQGTGIRKTKAVVED